MLSPFSFFQPSIKKRTAPKQPEFCHLWFWKSTGFNFFSAHLQLFLNRFCLCFHSVFCAFSIKIQHQNKLLLPCKSPQFQISWMLQIAASERKYLHFIQSPFRKCFRRRTVCTKCSVIQPRIFIYISLTVAKCPAQKLIFFMNAALRQAQIFDQWRLK